MSSEKVVLFDDREDVAEDYRDELNESKNVPLETELMEEDKFLEQVRRLIERRKRFRDTGYWKDGDIELDDADIFIIDDDLTWSDHGEISLSKGEELAYLMRCFSQCDLIIDLNGRGENEFDLKLMGWPASHVDLFVGKEHLTNAGLWGCEIEEREDFRPWYWPEITDYLESFRERVEELESEDINQQPIFDYLGFDEGVSKIIPNSIMEFINVDPTEKTFTDFVRSSPFGLDDKDLREQDHIPDDMVKRIVSAQIPKWLERIILPRQNIIKDAPHLVSSYPSLLEGDLEDRRKLNQTTGLSSPEELGIDHERISKHRWENPLWLTRPVWYEPKLSEDYNLPEVSSPFEAPEIEYRFCEDASAFFQDDIMSYEVTLGTSDYTRYIRRFDHVEYDFETVETEEE